MKTRLFIGNLSPAVKENELREKFDALFASHKGEAEIGNVEVRCKNEDNYFGFVDVHLKQQPDNGNSGVVGGGTNAVPVFLRKYVDLMNNTKWKGSLIKVQLAKESFIDKLKREQQEKNKFDNSGSVAEFSSKKNENYNTEQSRNKRQAVDILNKLDRSMERRNKFKTFQVEDRNTINKTNQNLGFEIVTGDDNTIKSPSKTRSPPGKQKQLKKRSRKGESSSSEDESDDGVRDGIPKFKGLLMCYPDGIPEPSVVPLSEKEKKIKDVGDENMVDETKIQKKLAFEAESCKKSAIKQQQQPCPSLSLPNKSTINFNKNKQQQSDILRLQSLEKMNELKTQRRNLIKSSLSSVAASAPVTEQRKLLESEEDDIENDKEKEPKRKKTKMTLFDDEDEDENRGGNDEVFKVKKQFEGASGQKLLELQTRWGNDDRFKIDDRFKESDNEESAIEPAEQEKEKQLDILTGILGKVVSSTKPTAVQKKGGTKIEPFSSVIMPRYDPEADDNDNEETKEKDEEKSHKKASREENSKSESGETTEKIIRSSEPVTFKTVSNLKSLFSSVADTDSGKENTSAPVFSKSLASQPQSSFSLLASFGNTDEDGKMDTKTTTKSSGSNETPRTFWQSNPFRYDSSDDEGEDTNKVKVTIQAKTEKPTDSTLFVHGKTSFFFTKNDERFKDLEDYFLKAEEKSNGDAGIEGDENGEKKTPVEDFSVKRQELKSIVKAKIRNSRRKDEKRTLAIKRAIGKKKRKQFQKNKQFGKF